MMINLLDELSMTSGGVKKDAQECQPERGYEKRKFRRGQVDAFDFPPAMPTAFFADTRSVVGVVRPWRAVRRRQPLEPPKKDKKSLPRSATRRAAHSIPSSCQRTASLTHSAAPSAACRHSLRCRSTD